MLVVNVSLLFIIVAPILRLPFILGFSKFNVVLLPPSVKVTALPSPFMAPDCSNIISTLFVPSPIKTSEEPSPRSISPTALVKTKLFPSCSILPALTPAVVLNCTSFACSSFMLLKNFAILNSSWYSFSTYTKFNSFRPFHFYFRWWCKNNL